MVAIGVEVLGPRERPNEKPGVLTKDDLRFELCRDARRNRDQCPQTLRLYHQESKTGATAVP
jgi:hypothetical protein